MILAAAQKAVRFVVPTARAARKLRLLLAQGLYQGQYFGVQRFRADRADMLVGDASRLVDDEGLRHPIDAEFDGDPPVEIGARAGIRVTQTVQPLARIFRLVLVVDAVDGNDVILP